MDAEATEADGETMSHYTCPECGKSGRDEVDHRPECSHADTPLGDRLAQIEARLTRIEVRLGFRERDDEQASGGAYIVESR
jgi:hypothetical protein